MSPELRARIAELTLATRELRALPRGPVGSSTRERFEAHFAWAERWFRAVLAVGLAGAPPPGALDPVARALEGGLLDELVAGYTELFDHLGHDDGWFFWARVPWEHVCVARSALGFARELLAAHPSLRDAIDLAEADERLERYAHELPRLETAPDGTPSDHWWWCGDPPRRSD